MIFIKRELKLLALLHLCIFSLDFSNLLLVPRLFSILEQFYSIWNNLILFGTILFFLEQFCSFWNNSIPVGIILFFLDSDRPNCLFSGSAEPNQNRNYLTEPEHRTRTEPFIIISPYKNRFISSIYCFSAVKITLGQISRTNRIMGQFSSNNSYFSLAMISLDNLLAIQKSNKISICD